ncbi:class I glutamine amidotransferase-like protein [Russula earlei]|uniref:Class I glutamine amidotransferase-like protein n=1 Tax=Russula earlei TaxID=71964 RepID=A0ACC0U0W3_9AGAM|nr:class I glutamine amidotransferase-like protein [Russula earlei]
MASRMPRLALLVCDTPILEVVKHHGEYPMIFDRLFRTALPDGVTNFVLDPYDVRNAKRYPELGLLDTYDGIIITGSSATAYEDVEWINKLVSWVAEIAMSRPRIKIIGICFGHQIVARALGGECISNGGKWEVATTEVNFTDLGQRIFGAPSLNLQQLHRDHVPTIPPSFHLLGSTSVTRNQGMVRFSDPGACLPVPDGSMPKIHILTLQGHPEFTAEIVKEVIRARSERGIIDKDTAEDGLIRADERNDGVIVGRVIWQVILQQ